MNVYDFDGTLYHGDSTLDFICFVMRRHPRLIGRLPAIGWGFCRYRLHRCSKTAFKESMFSLFGQLDDTEEEVALFWQSHRHKLKKYYQQTRRADDVVISASPTFLIRPGCALLGITRVIGSEVDPATGRYTGENCHGSEKIRRLRRVTDRPVEDFYSDSHADDPLAAIAQRAFLVKGEACRPWPGK